MYMLLLPKIPTTTKYSAAAIIFSLFISEYDGSQLTEISKSITSFRVVDKNQFLYTEYDGKKLSYYSFDAEKKEKKLIKTVEQEIDEKWIFM